MEFKEAFRLALQSLWANKLRTVLTLLGVVIGVSSVIAVVTLVNGANMFVIQKFSSYGADVFTVTKLSAGHHQLRRLCALPEAQAHPVRRPQVCGGELHAVRWYGRAAGGVRQGRTGQPVHHRRADPRLHVADAAAAEPGHHGRARADADRRRATPRMCASSARMCRKRCFRESIRSGWSCARTAFRTPSSAWSKNREARLGRARTTGSACRSTTFQKTYGTQIGDDHLRQGAELRASARTRGR